MCLRMKKKKNGKCGGRYLGYVHKLISMLSLDECRVESEPKHDMNSPTTIFETGEDVRMNTGLTVSSWVA